MCMCGCVRVYTLQDEDDNDPMYRAVKKAYLDASESAFQSMCYNNDHYRSRE